jgi:hypothetical protein
VPLCPVLRVSRAPWRIVTSATTTGTPSPWGSRPVGDPAVRLRCTYRARRRPPTHPLNRPHWTAPRATEVIRAHGFMPGHGTSPVTGVVPTDAHFHRWGLGFKQSSYWPYRAGLAAPRPERLQTATASLTCCCPLQLSPPGKSGDPRTSLRVPPDCVGDTTKRLTAHTVLNSLPLHGSYHPVGR